MTDVKMPCRDLAELHPYVKDLPLKLISATTNRILRKWIYEPFTMFGEWENEGIKWYLINKVIEQWVAAHYAKVI